MHKWSSPRLNKIHKNLEIYPVDANPRPGRQFHGNTFPNRGVGGHHLRSAKGTNFT